jgi:hypothetical protein
MIVPNQFKILVKDEVYLVDIEIDLGLAFPIICHPNCFEKEIIKFLESVSERRKYVVSILLIEKNPKLNTNDVIPLLVIMTPIPKDHVASEGEPNYPDNEDRIIYRYRQFINQFDANG